MLRKELKVFQTRPISSSALFQHHTAALPSKGMRRQIVKNLPFDLTCDVISGIQTKFCMDFELEANPDSIAT